MAEPDVPGLRETQKRDLQLEVEAWTSSLHHDASTPTCQASPTIGIANVCACFVLGTA